jgi:hypothetical protein
MLRFETEPRVRVGILILFQALALFWRPVCWPQSLDQFLHPKARIGSDLPSPLFRQSSRKPITPREAASYAVQRLHEKGVSDLVVCEAQWIAAPVSGYLVDALGRWQSAGKLYHVFRVGIRDGLERANGDHGAGEEFVFIALGREPSGSLIWYPGLGPDHRPAPGEPWDDLLPYEFLLRRADFESLPSRYAQ